MLLLLLHRRLHRVEAHPIPEHPRPRRCKGRIALVGDAAGYVTKCSGEVRSPWVLAHPRRGTATMLTCMQQELSGNLLTSLPCSLRGRRAGMMLMLCRADRAVLCVCLSSCRASTLQPSLAACVLTPSWRPARTARRCAERPPSASTWTSELCDWAGQHSYKLQAAVAVSHSAGWWPGSRWQETCFPNARGRRLWYSVVIMAGSENQGF